jgi:hypothetical protein
MPTLKVLFRLGDPHNLVDEAIMKVCGGMEVHAEALISDNPFTCFSAHLHTGVRETTKLEGSIAQWYCLDTGVIIKDSSLLWAKEECGQPYALLSAILSGFEDKAIKAQHADLHPLFCSMAVTGFAKANGLYLGFNRPNPLLLARRLKDMPSTPCEVPRELFV